MTIGKIISTANQHTGYARVRDEYGEEYTVHDSELPKDAKSGDDFAYYVDIWNHSGGNATTLKAEEGED